MLIERVFVRARKIFEALAEQSDSRIADTWLVSRFGQSQERDVFVYGENTSFGIVDCTSSRIARERENVLDLRVQDKTATVIQINRASLIIKPPVSGVVVGDCPNHAAYCARRAPQLSKQTRGVPDHQRIGVHNQLLAFFCFNRQRRENGGRE